MASEQQSDKPERSASRVDALMAKYDNTTAAFSYLGDLEKLARKLESELAAAVTHIRKDTDEIERLHKLVDEAIFTSAKLASSVEDAERYRYLRTYAEYVSALRVHWECATVPDSSDAWVPDYTLDNAIDDAMKRLVGR